MPIEVIMPKVDMDMTSGKIAVWHVAEGEAVAKGDPLFDIETAKAAMEIEAPGDGILYFAVPEGTEIPIGQPVAWLYAAGEEPQEPPQRLAGSETDAPAAMEAAASTVAVAAESEDMRALASEHVHVARSETPAGQPVAFEGGDRYRATPSARTLARDNALDLRGVPGTGPRGRIQAEDVRGVLRSSVAPTTPARFIAETGALAITRSKGGTGTPVVLIHGFASDAMSWAPIEGHLKHRPLIRIDLPGHGKSPKLRVPSFRDLVKVLREAFDSLALETAHLVGHSLGGALSLALADTRPRSVATLTLISPAGLGAEVNGAALMGICNATRPESLAPWLRTLVADERIVTDGYVRLAMAARSEPNLRAAQLAMADVLFPDGVQAVDLRAALERVEMPTRVIWGKQDGIIPWRHALRAPGHVGLHLFDHVGHMPQLEVADEIGKIIRSNL
jgi:pimeloyl-ACP methyl ester carboxylesterase